MKRFCALLAAVRLAFPGPASANAVLKIDAPPVGLSPSQPATVPMAAVNGGVGLLSVSVPQALALMAAAVPITALFAPALMSPTAAGALDAAAPPASAQAHALWNAARSDAAASTIAGHYDGSVDAPKSDATAVYINEGLLADGAMSQVYLGRREDDNRRVVLKRFVQPPGLTQREARALFLNEWKILSVLNHPQIPKALDLFRHGNDFYLVESFIRGETLEAFLKRRRKLSAFEAASLAESLLDVLEYLHKNGIVHRDLKPSNLLVDEDGELSGLVDFGAARRYRHGAHRDEILLGTPGFAAPEQYGTAQTDERSDIYALGALLYQLVTGLKPFENPSGFTAPHMVDKRIPKPFSDVIMRALRAHPGARPLNVGSMRHALRRALPLRLDVRLP